LDSPDVITYVNTAICVGGFYSFDFYITDDSDGNPSATKIATVGGCSRGGAGTVIVNAKGVPVFTYATVIPFVLPGSQRNRRKIGRRM